MNFKIWAQFPFKVPEYAFRVACWMVKWLWKPGGKPPRTDCEKMCAVISSLSVTASFFILPSGLTILKS